MIELLVVIAIFGILMGIAVVTMRGVGTKDIIKADADRVVAVLRQARNRAFNGIVNPADSVYPAGGWGLYLDNTVTPRQYILFADKSDDGIYDSDEGVATYTLSNNVNFRFLNGSVGTIAKGTIIFDGDSFPKLQNNCGAPLCLQFWTQNSSNIIFQIRVTGNSCIASIKFAPTAQDSSLRIEQSLSGC